VIALLVIVAVLSSPGCTKVSSGTPGGGNAWTVHGVLRIGAYEDVDSLNPILSNELYSTNIFQLLYSGLIDYDDRGDSIPDLAIAVPTQTNGGISRDGRTITYRLRRGVVWSDGAPLTAADVKYTWEQILNRRNNVAYTYPYDQATSIDTPDDYTVVVHLKEPSAPFVAGFMRNGSVDSIVPMHLLAQYSDLNRVPFNTKPIGSGPFVLARWDPGAMLELRPNARYFRGPPKLAEIQYRIIPNQNTLLTAVLSHSIDLFLYATESQFAVLKRVPGYRVTAVPNLTYEHVAFNCRRRPFDDVHVRQALAYAIDWKKMNDDVYLGVDTPGMADQSPLTWAFDPSARPYPHDPARARALLAESGWRPGSDGVLSKNGRRFVVDVSTVVGNGTRLRAEEMMQQNLRDIGIELNVRNYPANLLFASWGADGVLARGRFDMALYGWSENPDPDDTDTIAPSSIPPSGVNYSFYADTDIAAWLKGGKEHYSRAERKPYYWKIQERIHEAVPFHTINWQAHIDAVNTDLQNFRPVPAIADFWNSYEWNI
jgi:peptide/nickel transport system substrate-binding protein